MMQNNDTTSSRTAEITRATAETDIRLTLTLDGTGRADIHTGIGFFDHMLDGFSRHGLFDLTVHSRRAICRWTATTPLRTPALCWARPSVQAVGDKKGIRRFGSAILPMDETLVLCAVDLSGRPYLQTWIPSLR